MPERGEFVTPKKERIRAVKEAELIIFGPNAKSIPAQPHNPIYKIPDLIKRILLIEGYPIL